MPCQLTKIAGVSRMIGLPGHVRTYGRFAVLTVLLGFAFGSWSAAEDEDWKRYPYQPD